MSKVVLFAYTKVFVGGIVFGPTIRIFEIANALKKKGHEVVIAEPERKNEEIIEGIKFIPRNSKLLNSLTKNFDVAYCQIWDSEPSFLDSASKIPLIVDVYTPLLIEQSVFFSMNFSKITPHLMNAFIRDRFIPDARILKYGDLYLVASERQRYYYLGILTSLGIINPKTYKQDMIKIVPFGVQNKEPEYKGPVLKGNVVPENKRILIWPSGIMPWFDAETAIKAIKIVNKKYKDVVLVFVGALSKRSSKSLTYKGFKRAEILAKKLNLLNKNVFFTEWLPYDKRESIYFEAEFGICTYKKGYENDLSFRTRITDFFYGRMPVICSEGDILSEEIKKYKLGYVISEGDEKELAEKIIYLLENKNEIDAMKKNIDSYVKEFLVWDKVIEPIDEFCKNPVKIKKELKLDVYKILDDKEKIVKEQANAIKVLNEKMNALKEELKRNSPKKIVNEMQKEIQEKNQELKKINEELRQVYERLRLQDIERTQERIQLQKEIQETREQIGMEIKEKQVLKEKLGQEINFLNNELEQIKTELKSKEEWFNRINREFKKVIEEKDEEINKLKKRLNEILNSRGYKIAKMLDKTARALGLARKRKD
ncbi:MAG: glycosyltransferase [Candidatus Woesearchaeota archaeon]